MAGLEQEEADLEAQIQTYRDQLAVVKEKVSSGAGDELKQLLSDLEQLINLSEENLMEVKKHKLLLLLNAGAPGASTDGGIMATPQTQPAATVPPSSAQENVEGLGKLEESSFNQPSLLADTDELIGKRCSAPLEESWGGESHHNAVVLCEESEPCEVGDSAGDTAESAPPKVRVLFLQPLYPAMKPCSFFLESTCRFAEQECKFSHGHVVPLSKLRPYVEPDYSLAHIGGRCLAKYEGDGLWYQAILSSVGEECVVYFPSLALTANLPQQDIMPLESSAECSSASEGEREGEEEEEVVVEWRPSGPHSALGQWEKHTTGIGSKLLAKMGYVLGQGLGKESQGRVDPVEIVILPAGKSLDVCAKLREEKKVKTVDGLERRKKRKKKKASSAAAEAKDRPTDMFEFLNTKVFSRDTKADSTLLKKSTSAPAKNENLNVKLFKIQEDIKAVSKRRKSLKESLIRHQKRKDKQLADQVKEKLLAVDGQLLQLQRQEQAMQKNISTKSEQKKLAIF